MKNLIDLVNKSFAGSDKLNEQMAIVNEMKTKFVLSLSDEQCVEFLRLYVEIETLQKINMEEHTNHTHRICKDIFTLR